MKTLATTLFLSTLLFGTPLMAGSGHDHGHSHDAEQVNETTAEENADNVIASLIEDRKIDKSWSTIKANSVEKKEYDGHPEWVVIYNNEDISDLDKQTLYVFLTISGEYIAANYSGN